MHLNGGKLVKCNDMGETCWEYANGQKIYVFEKNVLRGLSAPAPGLYVYDHNFQISSSLIHVLLGQSKQKLFGA